MLTARGKTVKHGENECLRKSTQRNRDIIWDSMVAAPRPIAFLVDATGEVLARATAGPSNPLRAGYAKAWFALSDAADVVLERQRLKADDIHGICAGIGGAGRESVARRIATFLERGFPNATVSITTDLAITLHAAVGDKEGIILVVGTGSGAYGRDSKGHTARAGGRGPWFSDEGSGFDIGRRALAAVVRAKKNADRRRRFRRKY